MKLVALTSLFDISYGNKFDLCKMPEASDIASIAFVGRSANSNGVTAQVGLVTGKDPYPAGLITVALGGAILSSFVQPTPFYTAQNIAVLRPRETMTRNELHYYCAAIQHNKFRYSAFGREANRTLRELLVPSRSAVPVWVHTRVSAVLDRMAEEGLPSAPERDLRTAQWQSFTLGRLFDVQKGKRLTKDDMLPGDTLYIGATESNNGVTARIGQDPIHPGGQLTVSYNGSVAEAFYQPAPFWASDDVNVLYPRFEMSPEVAMFIATLIRLEKYRYNYGRKWKLEVMQATVLRLPATDTGEPDFATMEAVIQSLPSYALLGAA